MESRRGPYEPERVEKVAMRKTWERSERAELEDGAERGKSRKLRADCDSHSPVRLPKPHVDESTNLQPYL